MPDEQVNQGDKFSRGAMINWVGLRRQASD